MAHGEWPTRRGERVPGTEYVLDETLGQGRVTLACRVRDHDDQLLVLKVLLSHLAGASDIAERFLREARLFASFEHENVLGIADVGRITDGRPFFVTPWTKARVLASVIRSRQLPLTLDQAVAVAVQLTDALGAIHAAGAIHRAVHPGNVLLGWTGHVWLADFGVTSASLLPAITTPGEMYLEPRPEGMTDDPRADLFALGMIFYELFGARGPYPASDRGSFAARLRSGPPEPVGAMLDGSAVPRPLADLLTSMVAADPASRPASVWPVRETLRAVAARSAPRD
ncbi:MAG: serine/threonine protein kinase [Deltaproteobacteria bacterium]|nr:serine/threonine protein kinase [Deltaproteobacteria bacterium]